MRRFLAVALAAVLLVTLSGTAFAAKGGNKGGNGGGNTGSGTTVSSITLDQAGQTLSFGSGVTFTTVVAGLSGNQYPMVYLQCLQDTTVVYGQLDVSTATFVLGGGSSPWWNSPGPANCIAQLDAYGGNNGIQVLASTPWFAVAG